MYRCSGVVSAAMFFLVSGVANAIPFDVTTVGGSATVGVAGDYQTVSAAAAAFNALPAPYLQGHWNLVVLGNISDPDNAGFANTIPSGSSLTLKPAVDTSCLLTFTTSTANPGPAGNLVVGCAAPFNWANLKPTNNFYIDGSNGSTSTSLTITNTGAAAHDNSSVVAVVGDSDNVVVKNVIVQNVGGAGSLNSNPSAVSVVSRFDGTTVLHPDGVKLLNSSLVCNIDQAHGARLIVSDGNLAPSSLSGITGFEISGCSIQARKRGIRLESGMNGKVDGNSFSIGSVGNAVSGHLQEGISVGQAWGLGAQTLNITRNQIFVLSGNRLTGDFGTAAFQSTASAPGSTVNFVNNMVNFRFSPSPGASGNAMTYVGFRATGSLHYNLLHNSINMPHFSALDSLAPNGVGNASVVKLPEAAAYTANIEHNIFRLDQENAAVLNVVSSLVTPPVIQSNKNVIFRSKATCLTAVAGPVGSAANYLTLAAWQLASLQDANSTVIDPTATAGSKWMPTNGNADLHFIPATVRPTGLPTLTAHPSVPNDLDGEGRSSDAAIPGADEIFKAVVEGWNQY